MNSSDITSEAHINAAIEAITALVSEYETLDGRMAVPAQGRRAMAMERLCAVTFSTVTADLLDPYGFDDLSANVAEATLEYSLFVSDLLATAMLDFREKAALHGHRPENYRDRLHRMLLDIWGIALEELKKDGDSDQGQDPGNAGEAGDADDAGEWGGGLAP
jgi:hypothetical protein